MQPNALLPRSGGDSRADAFSVEAASRLDELPQSSRRRRETGRTDRLVDLGQDAGTFRCRRDRKIQIAHHRVQLGHQIVNHATPLKIYRRPTRHPRSPVLGEIERLPRWARTATPPPVETRSERKRYLCGDDQAPGAIGRKRSQHPTIALASRPSGVAVDMTYGPFAAAAPPRMAGACPEATSPSTPRRAPSLIVSMTPVPDPGRTKTRNRVWRIQPLNAAIPPRPPPLPTSATTASATIEITAAAVATTATRSPKRRPLTRGIMPPAHQPAITGLAPSAVPPPSG